MYGYLMVKLGKEIDLINLSKPCIGEAMAIAVQPEKEVSASKKPLTKQRRVVVTGMGVVTPIGHDTDVFYNNLLDGVSGISEIEAFDCSHFPTVYLINHLSSQF